MKIKKIIKIFILTLSIMTIFSCNYYNNDKTNITDNNLKKNRSYLKNISDYQLNLQKIYINNIVYFNFNESNIDIDFFAPLDYIANFLHNNKHVNICIEGHGDNQGTYKHNFILGLKRAQSIKQYLIKKGVLLQQISMISYGQEKIVTDGDEELLLSKNRRAIMFFYTK